MKLRMFSCFWHPATFGEVFIVSMKTLGDFDQLIAPARQAPWSKEIMPMAPISNFKVGAALAHRPVGGRFFVGCISRERGPTRGHLCDSGGELRR